MRRRVSLLVLILLLAVSGLQAAGTVTLSSATDVGTQGNRTTRYTYTWTSDASGNVSGDVTTIALAPGRIQRVELVPGTGGSQPTNGYLLSLQDSRGVDVLGAIASSSPGLSNAAATLVAGPILWVDRGENLQLVISGAGNAKGGTLIVWVGP